MRVFPLDGRAAERLFVFVFEAIPNIAHANGHDAQAVSGELRNEVNVRLRPCPATEERDAYPVVRTRNTRIRVGSQRQRRTRGRSGGTEKSSAIWRWVWHRLLHKFSDHFEKLIVRFRFPELLDQRFHRLGGSHLKEASAEQGNAFEFLGRDQPFFFTRTRL